MRVALVLALSAIFLQIAVFLQPLFPEKYQITQVCMTIAELQQHTKDHHSYTPKLEAQPTKHSFGYKHYYDHQCLFCTVYSHLVTNLDTDIKEAFIRIQICLVVFQKTFKHIFFVLQCLFLSPQGRAPPLFA